MLHFPVLCYWFMNGFATLLSNTDDNICVDDDDDGNDNDNTYNKKCK
jgi:hypothetical protein